MPRLGDYVQGHWRRRKQAVRRAKLGQRFFVGSGRPSVLMLIRARPAIVG